MGSPLSIDGPGARALLDAVRFPPERALIDHLFGRFGLDVLLDHFVSSGGARELYDAVLGSQLRLDPLLAPRLCSLLDEVREKLGFDEPLEMFVTQEAQVNASAVHALGPGHPHVLSLTSALVERMDDDELRFVLGHEVAHLAWRHYRARLAPASFGLDERGAPKAPPLLMRRMESWDRLAEMSADRAGLLVVERGLTTAVSAFFKIQSGLGPEHLRFDIRAFLEQLESIQKLPRRELLARFSHPAVPIRVRALQLFGEVRAGKADGAATDATILELAKLMDYAPSEPIDVQMRDLLVAGGMLVAQAGGGEITHDEWNVLVHLLLPFSADPESEVDRVRSAEHAEEVLRESAAWLCANAGEERFDALRMLANVGAIDGSYDAEELAALRRIATLLEVPSKSAEAILYETLSDHLQMQAVRGAPIPRLG